MPLVLQPVQVFALSYFPGAAASNYLLLTIGWWPNVRVPAF